MTGILKKIISGAVPLCIICMAAACSDEELLRDNDNSRNGIIDFYAATDLNKQPESRSGIPESTVYYPAYKMYGEGFIIESVGPMVSEPVPTPADTIMTRGTVVTEDNFNGDINVAAFMRDAGAAGDVYGETLIPSSKAALNSDCWRTARNYFWPGPDKTVKFYGWINGDAGSVTAEDSAPTMTMTVKSETEKQKDVLVATTVVTAENGNGTITDADDVPGDYGKRVKLHFKHALTAVKVVVSPEFEGTVKTVRITGVKDTGEFSFNDFAWTLSDNMTDFSQTIDKAFEKDENDRDVIAGDLTWLMLPQTLGEDAEIQVEFEDGKTMKGSLAGKEWPIGKTVTYRISKTEVWDEYILEATPLLEYEWYGDTKPYTVKSFLRHIDHGAVTETPVPWTAGGDAGKAEWMKDLTLADSEGSIGGKSYDAFCIPQMPHSDNPNAGNLMEEPDVNSSSGHTPYNLSNPTGDAQVYQTANCYLVNAPGTYSLPLVYGNAIDWKKCPKDGINKSSYSGGPYASTTLKELYNYLGRGITDPWIGTDTGNAPADAVLVWSDEPFLVQNVRLGVDGRSLVFDVPRRYIRWGSALVAVRDSEKRIMWTWHIWVTNYHLGDGIVEMKLRDYCSPSKDHIYHYMPVNVGHIEGENLTFDGRETKLTVTQAESGLTAEVRFVQKPHNEKRLWNSPYYQYGRKDPMCSSTGYAMEDDWQTNSDIGYKKHFDADGHLRPAFHYVKNPGYLRDDLSYWILNPETYCIAPALIKQEGNVSRRLWGILNLWSMKLYEDSETFGPEKHVKTIYDPCPAGYMVMDGIIPHIYKIQGQKKITSYFIHMFGGDGQYLCATDADGNPSALQLPYCGLIDTDKKETKAYLDRATQYGYYWTLLASGGGYAAYMFSEVYNVTSNLVNSKSVATPIRAMQEAY